MTDVLVVGAGIMGAWIVAHCRQRGLSVTWVSASSHDPYLPSNGDTRVLRMAYYESPQYNPLLRESLALWRDLEAWSGQPLFVDCGVVYVGQPTTDLISGVLCCGLESCESDPIQLQPGEMALMDREGGYLHAGFALHCLKRHLDLPIEISRIDEVGEDGESAFARRPDGSEIRARHAFVAAGLGTPGMTVCGRQAQVQLTRQTLTYWRIPSARAAEFQAMPVFAIQEPDGTFAYGFPLHDAGTGFKIALHNPGHGVQSPTYPSVTDAPEMRDYLAYRFGLQDADFISARHCYYESLPTQHLAFGAVSPRIGMVASTSGHGFKMAPSVAKQTVDAVLNAAPTDPLFAVTNLFA